MKRKALNPISILFSILLCIVAGCSSSPKTAELLSEYPLSIIDRPYTLPQGISSWKVTQAFAWSGDSSRNQDFAYILFPFVWEQSLSDDFSLVWFPLPLEFRWQIWRSPGYRLGLDFNVFANIIYQFEGFNWTPYLDINQRFYLGSRVAVDWDLHVQLEIRRSTPAFHYGILNWIGPGFQVADFTWIQAQIGLLYENGNPKSFYLGKPPVNPNDGPFWRFPLRMSASHAFHRQWQGSLTWVPYVIGFGGSRDYWNQALITEVTYLF